MAAEDARIKDVSLISAASDDVVYDASAAAAALIFGIRHDGVERVIPRATPAVYDTSTCLCDGLEEIRNVLLTMVGPAGRFSVSAERISRFHIARYSYIRVPQHERMRIVTAPPRSGKFSTYTGLEGLSVNGEALAGKLRVGYDK